MMGPSKRIVLVHFMAIIIMTTTHGDPTPVKAYCFKLFLPHKNGCTGASVVRVADVEAVRDTCCLPNKTSGGAAGYAHLSQPLGYPGYFMCDKCPDVILSDKTTNAHLHHHQHQKQHFLKYQQHKHPGYKKDQRKWKSDDHSTHPIQTNWKKASEWKMAGSREWYSKQEKKKMKLTNKTKLDKISNSVIPEDAGDMSEEHVTTRAPEATATTGDVTKARLMLTSDELAFTKNHYHHHHRHKHHHHHHHHRYRHKKTSDGSISTTEVDPKMVEHDVSVWSSWSEWTPCIESENGCVQRRTRFCLIASCPINMGDDYQERPCMDADNSKCSPTTPFKTMETRHVTATPSFTVTDPTLMTSHSKKSSLPWTSRSSTASATLVPGATSLNTENQQEVRASSRGTSRSSTKPAKTRPGVLLSPLVRSEKSKRIEKQYEWSGWQPCSASCGEGIQVRRRICLIEHQHQRLANRFGMKGNCSSDGVEQKPCKLRNCPVNGNWSEWRVTMNCTSSPCSGEAGVMTWSRTCINPRPSFGGRPCQGREWKREICYNNSGCFGKVDGGWCSWRSWVNSSKGSVRLRTCECPPSANGGKHCQGPSEQTLKSATTVSSSTTPTIARQNFKTQKSSANCDDDDDDHGSGDGSDVSCDQETLQLKLKPQVRSKSKQAFEDEDYDDDDDDDDGDDDDDVIDDEGSGSPN